MYWGAQSWMHYLIVASSTVRGRITSLLSTFFLMQPRMPLTFCTARSHWHLLFNSVSANASGQLFFFFFTKLLSRWSAGSIYWYMSLFLHRNFPGEICAWFCWTSLGSYLSKAPVHSSEWQHNYWEYQSLLLVLSHANLLRVHAILFSGSLMRVLSMGLSINAWCTLLVTGFWD